SPLRVIPELTVTINSSPQLGNRTPTPTPSPPTSGNNSAGAKSSRTFPSSASYSGSLSSAASFPSSVPASQTPSTLTIVGSNESNALPGVSPNVSQTI